MAHAELTCVTWNIRGSVGADGVERPERTVQVLQHLQPDIVALQEVDCRSPRLDEGDKLQWLARQTGLTAVAGPARWEGGGYFGNALLTRLPVASVQQVDISVAGRERRSILGTVLRCATRELLVIVTHFGLRARERARQVEALLDLVRSQPGMPAVVAGDFNEWSPRSRTMARLDRELGGAPAVRSFPACFPLLKLDRIWVRPRHALCGLRVVRNREVRSASDHLPVVATLRL